MEQWEYLTEFVWARVESEGWEEYRKANWPNFQPGKFAPETMIPHLNMRGRDAWELVHMEPVVVGKNYDVCVTDGVGGATWSNIYFCAFKRRIQKQ